ncbi:hypothetical protein BDF20DRAFT_883263 [Mycotypha africana]|uniref:uncharacterized protein n=1 Tax=Mycotypha africana TaxID=64632 RepID=UPI002301E85B|nr:uncharacterized protein BDF20DRAFT_883263 [Mycotypha africana]KAI8973612.1 hypothetical protein BDF20DRAFT_883263 [Mycotypha africana]
MCNQRNYYAATRPVPTAHNRNTRLFTFTEKSVPPALAGPSQSSALTHLQATDPSRDWDGLKDAMTEYKALNRLKAQHETQLMAGFKDNIERDCQRIKTSLHDIRNTVADVENHMDHLNAQTEALMNNMIDTIEE